MSPYRCMTAARAEVGPAPCSSWLQDILSAWILKKRLSGDVDKLRRQYLDETNPPVCSWQHARKEVMPITLKSTAGVFLMASSLMIAGFLWHLLATLLCPRQLGNASDLTKRMLPFSMPRAGEVELRDLGTAHAPMLMEDIRNTIEQSSARHGEHQIRQEERIFRQERKLDELRELVASLGTRLGAEIGEETNAYVSQLASAVARLRIAEDELQLQQQLQERLGEQSAEIHALKIQTADTAAALQEKENQAQLMKIQMGERVGESFELRQALHEKDEEIAVLQGQLGQRSLQMFEIKQQLQLDVARRQDAEQALDIVQAEGEDLRVKTVNMESLIRENEDLRLAVGERESELLEARTLLKDRCRDITALENRLVEKQEQEQQMSALWDLGAKMQSALVILEKVNDVLDKETPPPPVPPPKTSNSLNGLFPQHLHAGIESKSPPNVGVEISQSQQPLLPVRTVKISLTAAAV